MNKIETVKKSAADAIQGLANEAETLGLHKGFGMAVKEMMPDEMKQIKPAVLMTEMNTARQKSWGLMMFPE